MNDFTDQELLRDYAKRKSETAFAEIVRRHVDLVYSTALRMVRDADAAKDVTQNVFVALAQQARQLAERPALEGWLHGTARNLAVKIVRSEVRRRAREQEAVAMNQILSANPDINWTQLEPHLDEALGELSELDRDALMLRYFKNQDLRTVGKALGISDDAAQKRVSRAVERLREFLAKRGVTIGTSGLVVAVSANAVQAAPAGLALTVSAAVVVAGTTMATTSTVTLTATKAIAMTTLQKTLIAATVTILAGAGIYEAHQGSQLRDQVKLLQEQQAPLTEQIKQLQKERDDSLRALASLRDEETRPSNDSTEILRLRNEVAQLRAQRENTKTPTNQRPPPGAKIIARNSGARYLRKEDLANVGYATPVEAMQTITWALMKGSYDQANQGLLPEMVEAELRSPGNREDFEKKQSEMASLFKGIQILAQKNISADRVELKVKCDSDPIPNARVQDSGFMIQPLIKVGEEWKVGGSSREYTQEWEKEGNVFQYTP